MADSAAASPSATRSAPSSTEPSPRAADASSFTSNHSRPGSPRVNSIRRKPAPSSHGQESLQGLHGEGKETLAGVGDERTIAAGGGAAASSGRANSTTSASSSAGGHVPASPSSSTASHSFPPQPRPLSPTPSPNPPPAPAPLLSLAAQSTAYDYSSTTTPLGMSAYPSTAAARRPSIRSARSSVAPESVYGTQPVGVIGKHKPREVIRVERDYSGGELCQFWSGWIWELEGRISPTDFQNTLNELNEVLASAHDPYKSCFDNCCAVLTFYISPYLLGSHYEREMAKFDRMMDRANREIYNPAGLNLLSPRRNAYLFLEIEYY